MPVPTHASSCSTRMWKTACQFCNDDVFFFSCTCGSKVFFDRPGPPWPKHTCLGYLIYNWRVTDGLSLTDVRNRVRQYAADHGLSIPSYVSKLLNPSTFTGPIQTINILPDHDDCTVSGKIISVDAVNFSKRFKLQGAFGRAILGRLNEENYYTIIVRQEMDQESREALQFEFYYPKHKFDNWSGVRKNSNVTVELSPHRIQTVGTIWLANDLYPA